MLIATIEQGWADNLNPDAIREYNPRHGDTFLEGIEENPSILGGFVTALAPFEGALTVYENTGRPTDTLTPWKLDLALGEPAVVGAPFYLKEALRGYSDEHDSVRDIFRSFYMSIQNKPYIIGTESVLLPLNGIQIARYDWSRQRSLVS